VARSQVGETVQRIRRQLASSFRYEVSTLTDALTAVATDISVTMSIFPMSVIEGAVLSVGGEDMRVLTVDRPNKTCTVIRAWLDSTLEVHAVNDEVAINPRFSSFTIFDAIRDEIESWGPDLFRVIGETVPVAATTAAFELDSTFAGAYFIIEARRNITEDETVVWPQVAARVQFAPSGAWSVAPGSGFYMRIIEPSWSASSVFVMAAVPFDTTTMTATSDLIADIKLERSMLELVDLGVKMRLMYDAENNTSSRAAQDDPRRNEETPAGAAIGVARSIRQLYTRRRTEEGLKLRGRYPIRVS
jgi:hypothetical protein